MLETLFRLRESGTTARTEVVADSALVQRFEIAERVVAALLLGYFVFVRSRL